MELLLFASSFSLAAANLLSFCRLRKRRGPANKFLEGIRDIGKKEEKRYTKIAINHRTQVYPNCLRG